MLPAKNELCYVSCERLGVKGCRGVDLAKQNSIKQQPGLQRFDGHLKEVLCSMSTIFKVVQLLVCRKSSGKHLCDV